MMALVDAKVVFFVAALAIDSIVLKDIRHLPFKRPITAKAWRFTFVAEKAPADGPEDVHHVETLDEGRRPAAVRLARTGWPEV